MSLRILQFGATGQVARELSAAARECDSTIKTLSRAEADFARPEEVTAAFRQYPADIVINAAAYTAVDKAESEPDLARKINATAVGALAEACASRGVPLLHVSTDYVFDGRKPASYVEDDSPNPLNVYGRTKWEGEEAIRQAGGPHVILRTSWVYSRHGANFPKTILRLAAERDRLNIVSDQRGCPTSAADIAATILSIAHRLSGNAQPGQLGTFHYAGAPDTSWFEFAGAIVAQARSWAGLKAELHPIPSISYPTPAQRPPNSRLDCTKLANAYAIVPKSWRHSLELVLNQLKQDRGES
jgi:dTDP-4-dehydrorhamnose reductase